MDADGHGDRSWVLPAETDEQRRREERIRDGSELDTAQILLGFKGGFPEKGDYDDDEAKTDPPSSNFSTDSGSPAPLVPEVERRHVEVRNGDGSELGTARIILKAGGFPEKDHDDDDEAKTDPPSSNFSTDSGSSAPLMPEVEQSRREKRNRYRSKLDKAKTFQTAVATRVDPRLQKESPQSAAPVPSISKTEMHNNRNKTSQEEPEADSKRGAKRGDEDPSPDSETTVQSEVVVGMGFFSKIQENGLYGQVLGSTGVKKKRPAQRKDEDPSPGSEAAAQSQEEEVGLGFFSKLQEGGLYGQVVGSTGAKKKRKKVVQRRNKPKPDPLEGVSMGFFSGKMSDGPKEGGEKKEISDRLEPLYSWAPVLDEKFQTIYEFSSPVVLPWLAIKCNFKSFAWTFCMVVPFIHTLEVLLTNFGPNASKFHFSYAPLTPFVHMCIDLALNLPFAAACFVCPEPFGKNAYLYGSILFVSQYASWAVNYKNVVVRRKAEAKQLKAQ